MGELRVFRNADTTLSRFSARAFFGPLPVRIVSRRLCAFRVQVEAGQPVLDGLRAHAAAEVPAEPVPHLAVQQLVALEVLDLQVS